MSLCCNGFASFLVSRVVAVAALSAPLVAQTESPKPPAPAPAVTLLGEVGVATLPLAPSMTVFDAFFAAKVEPTAHREGLVLVRCTAEEVLTLRIDVVRMMKTGDTKANVMLRDGDLLFVPSQAMAAKTELDVVDAMRREAPTDALSPVARARLAAWRLLVEKDAVRRQALVEQFGACSAHGACVVAPLAAALAGDAAIARDAATALGMIGAAAAPALGDLRRHADGEDAQLAARCKAAIRVIEASVAHAKYVAQDKVPTRSLAAGLARQQAELSGLRLPQCASGAEIGAGEGPLVLLVRRADGALETVELQRGAGDHGPRAEPPPPPAELEVDAPEPPGPVRIELRRDGDVMTLAVAGRDPALRGKTLDPAAGRAFFASLLAARAASAPKSLVFDAGRDVTMQQWLTAWAVAREVGWTGVLFDGGGAAGVVLDEAPRAVIQGLAAKHGWAVRQLTPQQPVCRGELLIMLEGEVAWGDVRPLVFELARAGIWEFGFVVRKDAATLVKLPTPLPTDRGN